MPVLAALLLAAASGLPAPTLVITRLPSVQPA